MGGETKEEGEESTNNVLQVKITTEPLRPVPDPESLTLLARQDTSGRPSEGGWAKCLGQGPEGGRSTGV